MNRKQPSKRPASAVSACPSRERLWLASYPAGVPAEIDLDNCPSLVALFDTACRRHAGRVAFISMGRRLTYRQLDAWSRDFAGWLQSVGCGKGTRVALMMPNLLQYPVALFGALRAGCVVVNCNPLYTPRELEAQLQDAGAEVVVIVENFAHTLQQVIERTAVRQVIVTPMGELLGWPRGALVNAVLRHVRKLVPPWSLPGATSLTAALAGGRRHGFTAVALTAADLAFLQYTGGTTGVAKGAMLTHGNIVANVMQAHAWIKSVVTEGQERVVTALPLYHIFALTANCLVFVLLGAQNLLIANPRDIPGVVRELSKYPFSILTGVNTLFNALLNNADFARLDFSHLKVTLGGGMAVQPAVAERWAHVTGKMLQQAYGLTEAAPAVTINPLDRPDFDGSVGLPVPSTDLVIRDEAGRDLPPGQVGEICIRGPQVMAGYWRQPAETANVMAADGFLHTGDLGYINAHGYVFLVDRKKDVIVVSGFMVYPSEVEAVAARHPGVLEAAAVGVPDAVAGEAVKLFVVRRDPDLSAAALIAHCRTELTGYKVPKQIEFRSELPHNTVGKPLRRALREKR